MVVKRVTNRYMLDMAYQIRIKVFVLEQGVPKEIELDEYDAVAHHVVAFRDTQAVGCGRVFVEEGKAKLGRIAVLQKERKKGIGKEICEELIAIAMEKGAREMVLNSQITAVGFYQKLGFREIGETFMEAGIEHIKMVRRE